MVVEGSLKSERESDGGEALLFVADRAGRGRMKVEMGVRQGHEVPVADDGPTGSDLIVVEVEEVLEFAKDLLDLPAQGEAVDDLGGRKGQPVGDEHMGLARVSGVPGAEGDNDLLPAFESFDLGKEGIGEEDSGFARGAGNRYRALESVTRDDFLEVICVNPVASVADESIAFGLGDPGQIARGVFEERDEFFRELPGVEGLVGEGDWVGYSLLDEGFGQLEFGLELTVERAAREMIGRHVELQGDGELPLRMSEGREDGDVGLDRDGFAGDVLRRDGVGFEGVRFFAGGVINHEDALADGAAMMRGLNEAKALGIELVGVPLGLGEKILKGLVRAQRHFETGGLEAESVELQEEGRQVAQKGFAQPRGEDRSKLSGKRAKEGTDRENGVDHPHTPWAEKDGDSWFRPNGLCGGP